MGTVHHICSWPVRTTDSHSYVPCRSRAHLQCCDHQPCLRCDYHWPQIKASINHLLKRLKEGEARIDFYQKILNLIDAAKLIIRCHFDEDKGAEMPLVAALTRWGTTLAALSNLFRKHPIYACALIPNFAHAPEDILVKACVDILSEKGFASSDYGQMRLEKCAELIFNFLTQPANILQMAIGHVLHVCVMQILLAAVSANHECGAPLSQGMESVVRAILLMFRRDFFVRLFPGGGWGRGWNKRAAIGCRTHGAEFDSARGTGPGGRALVAQGSTGFSINRAKTLSHARVCQSAPLAKKVAVSKIATFSLAHHTASLCVSLTASLRSESEILKCSPANSNVMHALGLIHNLFPKK